MESDLELESLTRSVSVRMRLRRSYRAAWLPAINDRHLHFSQQSQYAVGDVFFSLHRTAPDFYFQDNFGLHSNSAGSQFSVPLKTFQRRVSRQPNVLVPLTKLRTTKNLSPDMRDLIIVKPDVGCIHRQLTC